MCLQSDFDNPSMLFILEDFLKFHLLGSMMYDRYFQTFRLKGDERVLDFGCGGGTGAVRMLKMLSGKGSLIAVDTSSYWMRKTEKRLSRYPNAECCLADIRTADIPESSFDLIMINHVLHDIPAADRQETVRSLAALLNDSGNVFIWEPVRKSHGMPSDEIRDLFTNAGLIEESGQENKSVYKGKFIRSL